MATAASPEPGGVAAALTAAAPPGMTSLDAETMVHLRRVTAEIVAVLGGAGRAELGRFQEVRDRALPVDRAALSAAHEDRTVLITGGTGCIGSSLARELTELGPRRIISVSRGSAQPWPRSTGIEYVHLDVRDRQALFDLVTTARPDIVYHLAALHDPGLAEREVSQTISTNVTGTVNVVDACRLRPGVRLACASTGKAVRPFSRDVYAASKKMNEWILRQAARNQALRVSAVRFTHVVDNSIILERLHEWTSTGACIRLHSPDTVFYLQSAREAAQLMLSSVLDVTDGSLTLGAIRDLGWPISLLDLAIGVASTARTETSIYICGVEAGYEQAAYPGLYDPMISGARSPLFNSLEAPETTDSIGSSDVDVYRATPATGNQVASLIRRTGADASSGAAPEIIRTQTADCGWAMFRDSLGPMPTEILDRHATLLRSHSPEMLTADDSRVRSMVANEVARRSVVLGDRPFRRSA